MFIKPFQKKILSFLIVAVIFLFDRTSKLYILNLIETKDLLNIYINEYLNFYMVWNTGVGFGLLSSESNFYYNLVTILIIIINIIIIIMIFKSKNYNSFFLLIILGGSLGNLFDRVYYKAVPDFIDLHYNDFHWFIFNVADIFITIGVISLIIVELLITKNKKD